MLQRAWNRSWRFQIFTHFCWSLTFENFEVDVIGEDGSEEGCQSMNMFLWYIVKVRIVEAGKGKPPWEFLAPGIASCGKFRFLEWIHKFPFQRVRCQMSYMEWSSGELLMLEHMRLLLVLSTLITNVWNCITWAKTQQNKKCTYNASY